MVKITMKDVAEKASKQAEELFVKTLEIAKSEAIKRKVIKTLGLTEETNIGELIEKIADKIEYGTSIFHDGTVDYYKHEHCEGNYICKIDFKKKLTEQENEVYKEINEVLENFKTTDKK